MEPVRSEALSIGLPLPHALYTRAGRLLAHGGTVLTPAMAQALPPGAELRYDTRADPSAAGGRARAAAPPAGRGPDDEEHDRRDWERRLIRTRAELRRSAAPLVQVARLRWDRLPRSVVVGVDPVIIHRHGAGAAPVDEVDRSIGRRRAAGVTALRGYLARLLNGEHQTTELPSQIADDLVDAAGREPEVYSILALGLPRPTDSLPDHAYTSGALAAGIAVHLGWPRADARAAALTGLLCDAGMGLVPHPVRTAGRDLTEIEVNAVRRHPEYTVALLRSVRGIPESVVLACYQHHERSDGSGYPLGARAELLHDYAMVAAVADTMAGMTAPRAHRPARTPHAAMSELARLAAAGTLQGACVRALIDLLGLYPAGSFVRLSTGHVAIVGASAPPGASDQPVIRVVQPTGAPARFGRPIDLRLIEPKVLRVIEAVPAPAGV